MTGSNLSDEGSRHSLWSLYATFVQRCIKSCRLHIAQMLNFDVLRKLTQSTEYVTITLQFLLKPTMHSDLLDVMRLNATVSRSGTSKTCLDGCPKAARMWHCTLTSKWTFCGTGHKSYNGIIFHSWRGKVLLLSSLMKLQRLGHSIWYDTSLSASKILSPFLLNLVVLELFFFRY